MASRAAIGNRRAGRAQMAPPFGPQVKNLPRIAASRKRCWRFSADGAGASTGGRRIDNPPQVKNLPHNLYRWYAVSLGGRKSGSRSQTARPG